MDVEEFVHWLCCRNRHEIDAVLDALQADHDTADGAVGRLRARREIERDLRRAGRSREAGVAAHRATVAALEACRSTGLCDTHRGHANRVARAAGDAALGIVAGGCSASIDALLRPFLGPVVLDAS